LCRRAVEAKASHLAGNPFDLMPAVFEGLQDCLRLAGALQRGHRRRVRWLQSAPSERRRLRFESRLLQHRSTWASLRTISRLPSAPGRTQGRIELRPTCNIMHERPVDYFSVIFPESTVGRFDSRHLRHASPTKGPCYRDPSLTFPFGWGFPPGAGLWPRGFRVADWRPLSEQVLSPPSFMLGGRK
jgi:hypothetical protein